MTKEYQINVMSEIIIDILTELSETGVPDKDMKDAKGKPYKILLSIMSIDTLEILEKATPMNWGNKTTA